MIESVLMLERIATSEKPPLDYDHINELRSEFMVANGKDDGLRKKLEGVEDAFLRRGDLSSWEPEVLTEIDEVFVSHYMVNGEPTPFLFFPKSSSNANAFETYCSDVDLILRNRKTQVPEFAREYFAFYSIYQMRGYAFPVPLGTRSVIFALHQMATAVKDGFTEVSRFHLSTPLMRGRSSS
jgi:hypothetical protein